MRVKTDFPTRSPRASSLFQRFYQIIARIPRGHVATYGQIARLAGLPRHARHVGYALAAPNGSKLPWQRVINSKGEISLRATPFGAEEQKAALMKEGIRLNRKGRVDLGRYQWAPARRQNV
jgi:methylated-DNA-protein-cysteine methyltransferase-like protein